ncbi:MAG: hypothetical protein DI529_14270 [Chryseobacterium sp.]|nr:MAG: hypothetical protein DI529_14270 [Chryseobacterium sp.]
MLGLIGNEEGNKADIDPINGKVILYSIILLIASGLIFYFFKSDFFELNQLFISFLISFGGSFLLSFGLILILNKYKIIHSLTVSSFVISLISSSIFLSLIILLLKI